MVVVGWGWFDGVVVVVWWWFGGDVRLVRGGVGVVWDGVGWCGWCGGGVGVGLGCCSGVVGRCWLARRRALCYHRKG